MNNDKIKLLAVVGPTASGKTELAVRLAKHYDGEIISADSMQIYKGMDIATAKPTEEEKHGIIHHLTDFLDPDEEFSVSDYTALAHKTAADINGRGKLPVLCGGTGLYIRSFLENIKFPEAETDISLRNRLNRQYENEGGERLLEYLSGFDPETAASLLPQNGKRIIRAIEIYETTGITMSEHIRHSRLVPSPYDYTVIGLTYSDRQMLYDRINKRVDIMLERGLIEEARAFYGINSGNTASAAIGYKELKPYLDGEMPLDEAVERLKQATRHYAKRQLTWFRRDKYINWIEIDKCDSVFEEAKRIFDARKGH